MKTTLERAFELARSGKYASMKELQRTLAAEGYAQQQLTGPVLFEQLRRLMKASKPPSDKA
nr:hypothetical protein [Methylobacterium sp. ZNC0032]